ncbi:restriction endonuclease subunit S [Citrobacter braakii]|uniref:restriction endonuclease subunit S n=1 Tax=Citrobacter braakii TaxID=57706 RepID=UPI003855C336
MMLPSVNSTTSAPGNLIYISWLNGWPVNTPVNASPHTSRYATHDSGTLWIAGPSMVGDFHPLISTGLPAHTGCISVYYPVFNFEYGDNYFYTIMFNYYKHIFRAYAVGSSQLVLSITDLKKMNFLIPSPNEQKKISELFLAMESRISANRQEINKLKSWKQGLLQQMFI